MVFRLAAIALNSPEELDQLLLSEESSADSMVAEDKTAAKTKTFFFHIQIYINIDLNMDLSM